MRFWLAALLICAGLPASGEPPRSPEIFGTLGAQRAGGDEGSPGSAAAYGGAASLPFARRWAVDVLALASSPAGRTDYSLRRILLLPGLQYRRGGSHAYWFFAFGPGLQRDRTRGTYQVFDITGAPRDIHYDLTGAGLALHWRTGAVFQPARRLLLRGDFYWANRNVLPNLGAAISLGIRLGR
jgi:hypothetical protein